MTLEESHRPDLGLIIENSCIPPVGRKELEQSPGRCALAGKDQRSFIARVFAVLGTFDAGHRRQRLSGIARKCGLPLTTTHRIVGDLASQGALIRTRDGSYEVGSRIWNLGILASLHADLRELALPYMEDIYQVSDSAVQIAVLDGMKCLIVERIAGSRTLEVISKPGARLPLHASGVGKVLLAFGSLDLQEAALKNLDRHTPNTIVSQTEMHRQLRTIQSHGYAVSLEELMVGAASVAVPIRGRGDRVIAALGIVSPVKTIDLAQMVSVLRVTARALSGKLIGSSLGESLNT